jgi:minor histocompatibility antigen H13
MAQVDSNPVVETIIANVTDILQTLDLVTENVTLGANETTANAWKATPQGLALAYCSLFIMALIPIIVGSFKSVRHQHTQKTSGEEIETMSTKEAMLFPVVASCTLFSIYIVFQIFSKDHINLLLAFYFFLLGVIALTRMFGTFMARIWPSSLPNEEYELDILFKKTGSTPGGEVLLVKEKITYQLVACFLVSLAIGIWYFTTKHWIANNIFGLAFAVNGIEFLQLNKVLNGCILLGGLFFYDIFWVFATNVMVSVAKSFDAPIKLIFPQDLIENGFGAEKFALLGLGDIVIPGIFIALLLRFDMSTQGKNRVYFYTSFVAYILGLGGCIVVMHVFKHAQPALLYIVPSILIIPLGLALIKGDIKQMFSYRDHEDFDRSLNTSTSSEKSEKTTAEKESPKETKKSN